MTKRFTSLPGAGRCRRWGAALVVATLAASVPSTMAQSVLRFVESGDDTTEVVSRLPDQVVSAVPEVPPSVSEFRLLEMRDGKFSSQPQFSTTSRRSSPPESAGELSTLTFAPAAPDTIAATAENRPASCELRFVASTPRVRTEPVAPVPKVAEIAAKSPAKTESKSDLAAKELFATPPQTRPNAFKPRIVTVLEHIPAPAPQHVEAQPVGAAREAAPTFAPAGTELFVSAAPKRWDLPALDYGSALRQVEPPQPAVVAVKPNEPARVVARELPPAATGMFTFASPQPIIVQPPAAERPAFEQSAISKSPVVAEPKVAAPTIAVPAIAAAPLQPVAAPIAVAPAAAVPRKALVATPTPTLPSASELDFSRVPVQAEPPKPQFVSTAPSYVATATPIAAPAAPERLVPATVSRSNLPESPFASGLGELANESRAVDFKPAAIAPSATVPERNQVIVTAEPSDPNVYTFRFAGTTNDVPATLVNNTEPTAANSVAGVPPAMFSEALSGPCGCNDGAGGQDGCPYLPGQSGTRALCGVDCGRYGAPCCSTWSDAQCIPWALFGPGEYIGPARPAHVETYFLRVNDFLTLTFIESRKKSAEHYRIGVGDELQIEWLQGAGNTETPLNRKLLVQPDGTVTLPLIGEVLAAGKTVTDFHDEVVKLYSKYQREPQITVTPLTVNVAVQDVLKAVTSKSASSGQTQDVRVTPEGTIQAAGIGSVYVQGLTLDELRSELEARYAATYGPGLAVSPQLTERATSYVFMGGEVRAPGRYTLEGPTTVMQAISMSGGWNNGGNVRQVVVFRRDENWCLKATKIDVRAPLYGNDPCPTNDVWLRENDLVIVPKTKILCATDLIELYFTRGVYAVFPINYVYDFSQNSGIVPIP